jgi:hypothetical protein
MTAEPIERLHFFQFQYLGAEDLSAGQAYHRDMRRRHNLGPHSWGIVTGCRIVEKDREGDAPFVDIYVLPGIAVDGYGRDIVVLEPARVDPELFAAFTTDRHLELWVRYDELAAAPAAGGFAPCIDATSYSRVRETYRFAVGTIQPSHGDVIVAGKIARPKSVAAPDDPVLPDDESVAYQDFPEAERQALWLVRLGTVHWDGTVHKFRKVASADNLIEGRLYAGFVGSSLLSESNTLRIAPRVPFQDVDGVDFARLEGRLRVDGRIVAKKDVFLHGGKLSLQSAGGSDETRPLWLQRLPQPSGSGADLRIHIGDSTNKDTRLTIGPGPIPTQMATEKVVLAVRGDDRVDIPTGRLRFGTTARQCIDLSVENDADSGAHGIGRQSNATYFRSASDFYWYRNGEHDNTTGNPGTGGTTLMRLDGQGSLHFTGNFRQLVNAQLSAPGDPPQSYGMGAQENTLYQRSQANFAWYRGGGHAAGQLDPGGGSLAMSLDSASRLTVTGGVTSKGDIVLWGNKLDFRNTTGGTDTDRMEISRFSSVADATDLRVVIGDNIGGDDRLVVGPIHYADGLFKEQFIVENNGDARIARDLYVGGRKALIDVMSGEVVLNRTTNGSGTYTFNLVSRLPRISGAQLMVALSDIGNNNVANDARWRVQTSGISVVGTNSANFSVAWRVDDSDGWLIAFSYVAIFLP